MRAVKFSLFAFLLVIAATYISYCEGSSNVLCIESEGQALLKFKHGLLDLTNRLSSWVDGEDCCKWHGVICNNMTGHVNELHLGLPSSEPFWSRLAGKINPLMELKRLSFLDLSNNEFERIPKSISSLKGLTYLNLSGTGLSGEITHILGNLSKLHHLDLGNNFALKAQTLQWVSGLSSLQYLDLSQADLRNATDWLQVINKLPSLLELHLSDCKLNNDPSPISVNFTSLKFLDLSLNSFSPSSIPSWLSNLNQLQFLGLRRVGLQGNFSSVIGNMSSLAHLDLSKNHLEIVPKCFESLCNLREMDLSYNGIDQEVSEIIESLSKCSLDRLESLNMAFNKLFGHLIGQLGQFKNLAYLWLSENSISGPIPFSIGKLSSLKVLDLSKNRLNATLPQSLGQLGNLEYLDVSSNMLEGNISEMHFYNLTRLRILSASNNMITFKPNPSWIPPFHCERIFLGNWHLGPQFPQWLQFQKNLSHLDVSRAGILGDIPNWLGNLSTKFEYLNFSDNQFMGGISYLSVTIFLLDLSSNQFRDLPPLALSNTNELFLSKNLFSGPLSNFLCNFSNPLDLIILDMDSNLLSGEIPDCWENLDSLVDLNLGNNNLTGKLPISMGSMRGIIALSLRNNSLFGEVPSTLQHLADVIILDLSKNKFAGSVPGWFGDKLSNLMVLNLRSNNFQGNIPHQICGLKFLQVLDLGYNNISGVIPKCFGNLSAIATKTQGRRHPSNHFTGNSFSFYVGTVLVMKGREDEYSTILGLVTSINLSVNNLIGEIPEELGNLIRLRSLTLSRNLLTGKIPESIGNMELLEALDLSINQLHGEIPSSFSKLNFLNRLNLSYNHLTGQIPTGTQLQSFDESSYIGNHLCGPPISKSCSPIGKTPNSGSHEGRKGSKVNGLYVSIVIGFVMGFWGVVAPLFFIKSWRFACYKKLEQIGDKLYVFWATIGK